jgi:hypothetical protein
LVFLKCSNQGSGSEKRSKKLEDFEMGSGDSVAGSAAVAVEAAATAMWSLSGTAKGAFSLSHLSVSAITKGAPSSMKTPRRISFDNLTFIRATKQELTSLSIEHDVRNITVLNSYK